MISDQRPVGSKDVDFESGEGGRAMGEESKSTCMLPYAFLNPSPFRNVSLTNKTESPVASFPPTNNSLDQY